MCDYCGDKYEPGCFYPEDVFYPNELRDYLKQRRLADPEYRLDLDEKFILDMEKKSFNVENKLLKVDQKI